MLIYNENSTVGHFLIINYFFMHQGRIVYISIAMHHKTDYIQQLYLKVTWTLRRPCPIATETFSTTPWDQTAFIEPTISSVPWLSLCVCETAKLSHENVWELTCALRWWCHLSLRLKNVNITWGGLTLAFPQALISSLENKDAYYKFISFKFSYSFAQG